MKKRLISSTLAMALALSGLTGCGNSNQKDVNSNYVGAEEVTNDYELVKIDGSSHEYKKYKDMTTEDITLTYFHFDQDEIVQRLADRFMQIYPNIKVDVKYEQVANYNTTLGTLVSNGECPDVIMHSDCDYALSNQLLMDISKYWNSDEETKNVADTVNDAGLGTYHLEGGQRCRGIYARDFYGNYADSYNFGSFFDYSIVDENGDLSPHVVFKPGE